MAEPQPRTRSKESLNEEQTVKRLESIDYNPWARIALATRSISGYAPDANALNMVLADIRNNSDPLGNRLLLVREYHEPFQSVPIGKSEFEKVARQKNSLMTFEQASSVRDNLSFNQVWQQACKIAEEERHTPPTADPVENFDLAVYTVLDYFEQAERVRNLSATEGEQLADLLRNQAYSPNIVRQNYKSTISGDSLDIAPLFIPKGVYARGTENSVRGFNERAFIRDRKEDMGKLMQLRKDLETKLTTGAEAERANKILNYIDSPGFPARVAESGALLQQGRIERAAILNLILGAVFVGVVSAATEHNPAAELGALGLWTIPAVYLFMFKYEKVGQIIEKLGISLNRGPISVSTRGSESETIFQTSPTPPAEVQPSPEGSRSPTTPDSSQTPPVADVFSQGKWKPSQRRRN